ncbi:MAG TPA: bifunctional 3'-5' exonuclease/DNA polymerase, partial [Microbacteriaceae bacterium]|nr:bifunctional 3'-5' exonuclease/DNA polymerase [Microbacteriaceae bacterium]
RDALRRGAHLVYFLHDELVVHTPEADAEQVAQIVRHAAWAAGRMLFPASPATFPVTVDIVERYADAS